MPEHFYCVDGSASITYINIKPQFNDENPKYPANALMVTIMGDELKVRVTHTAGYDTDFGEYELRKLGGEVFSH